MNVNSLDTYNCDPTNHINMQQYSHFQKKNGKKTNPFLHSVFNKDVQLKFQFQNEKGLSKKIPMSATPI